jgi:hypothetical protein
VNNGVKASDVFESNISYVPKDRRYVSGNCPQDALAEETTVQTHDLVVKIS